jgi:hypothetical protein
VTFKSVAFRTILHRPGAFALRDPRIRDLHAPSRAKTLPAGPLLLLLLRSS